MDPTPAAVASFVVELCPLRNRSPNYVGTQNALANMVLWWLRLAHGIYRMTWLLMDLSQILLMKSHEITATVQSNSATDTSEPVNVSVSWCHGNLVTYLNVCLAESSHVSAFLRHAREADSNQRMVPLLIAKGDLPCLLTKNQIATQMWWKIGQSQGGCLDILRR